MKICYRNMLCSKKLIQTRNRTTFKYFSGLNFYQLSNTSRITINKATKSFLSTEDGAQSWNWVPPRHQQESKEDEEIIPIIERTLLTENEIKEALERQGAENVDVVHLQKPLDTITKMIFATGKSTRHLKKMSDSIVRAVRKLFYFILDNI